MPVGCGRSSPVTPQGRLNQASEKLAKAKTDQERFYALGDAAKQSFILRKTDDARSYASNLLALLPQFPNDWNYGNAVQDGNLVLEGATITTVGGVGGDLLDRRLETERAGLADEFAEQIAGVAIGGEGRQVSAAVYGANPAPNS